MRLEIEQICRLVAALGDDAEAEPDEREHEGRHGRDLQHRDRRPRDRVPAQLPLEPDAGRDREDVEGRPAQPLREPGLA